MDENKAEQKRILTVAEAGRLGGQKVAERGPEHFKAIGHLGGVANREKHGPEYFRAIGAKGGKATAATHCSEHFEAIGRKGGARVRQLLEKAKALEAAGATVREQLAK